MKKIEVNKIKFDFNKIERSELAVPEGTTVRARHGDGACRPEWNVRQPCLPLGSGRHAPSLPLARTKDDR